MSLLQKELDGASSVIEIQKFQIKNPAKRHYRGKIIPYEFSECYPCINETSWSSTEILNSGSFRINRQLLSLIKSDIFIRCSDAIVGPFTYKADGDVIVIDGSGDNKHIISWFKVDALKRNFFQCGDVGGIELLQRSDVSSARPILRRPYVKVQRSAHSKENGKERISEIKIAFESENESLTAILRRFGFLDGETSTPNLTKLECRLKDLTAVDDIRKTYDKQIVELKNNIQHHIEKNKELQQELDRLLKEQLEKDAVASRQKNDLLEIEKKVGQALEDKVTALQKKIDEYKTVAGGLSAQVTQNLRGKIIELISSVSIAETSTAGVPTRQLEQQDDRKPEKQYMLPLIQFNADLRSTVLGTELIKRVQGYLAAKNRFCSVAEVANYLVCLTQGFMTTFAGNPGSGKTSLCNLLAKALGLVAEHDGTHFVDVPVSRGWTSAKDFIGYHNPLTKEMVPSNAAVYKALALSEKEDSREVPPMVILLDEANLSPLEHYWSSFLKNSDFSSSAARTFSLGGDKVWKINPHLRFLATVNHDHTTEELSPRFLDRSWVILLDGQSSEVDTRDVSIPNISGEWAAIPYAKLEEAFGVAAHSKLPMKPEVLQLWTDIRAAMQESQMPIMPRNINMVENYVKAASLYISDTFSPLDYAMAQKILPTLSGSGERMKTCLMQMHRLCDGKLPRTAALLARMQEAGKHNMEMYQFFVQ